MQFGFCVFSRSRDVQVRLMGQEVLNGLLALHESADSAVVFLGRIHYREDVLESLPDPPADADNDAAMVAAVYRQSGVPGISRLEGCFAFVIWDGARNELLARRDVLGGFPLYWAQRGQCLAVGTSLDAVRAQVSAGTLDPEYQAEYLMLPCCGQHEPACERTPYRGVQRLLPANLLEANVSADRVTVRQYWNWLDHIESPDSGDLAVLADHYRELLCRAVGDRMRGVTAAHLSGGMDSTSVALLALAEVESGAKDGPLHTLSLTYDQMKMLARERPVIEGAVQGRNLLRPHFIAADDLLDFGHYDAPPRHEEPWPWLSMVDMEVARVEAAAQLGVQTVLTGQGADELLDMGPYHLADLIRRGRLTRAWSEACQSARAENCSVWKILYPFGIFNVLPRGLPDSWGSMLRGGRSNWLQMSEASIPPWIRPGFARHYRLRARALEHVHRVFHSCRPTVLSVALSKIAERSGDLGRWYLSAPRGILVEHPFLDSRLLRFLLGVHAHVAPGPRTTPKPLLTEAVRGILPDAIRLRPKAGFFNEPYYRGITRHAAVLRQLVRRSDLGQLDWLDKNALLDCLGQSALGIGNDRIQLDRINLTLSWLRWQSLSRDESTNPPSTVHTLGCGLKTPRQEKAASGLLAGAAGRFVVGSGHVAS